MNTLEILNHTKQHNFKRFRNTDYYCNENGLIYSDKSKKFIASFNCKKGYLNSYIYIDKVKKTFKNHRIVAECFIENSKNKPQINHIDGNKQNNHFSNLEWVNNSENMKHAYRIGLNPIRTGEKHQNTKFILDLETGIFYCGRKDAANAMGITDNAFKVRRQRNYKNYAKRFIF
jgi:hypothetical protein